MQTREELEAENEYLKRQLVMNLTPVAKNGELVDKKDARIEHLEARLRGLTKGMEWIRYEVHMQDWDSDEILNELDEYIHDYGWGG